MFERTIKGLVIKSESGKYYFRAFRKGYGDMPHFVLNLVDDITQATIFESKEEFLNPVHPYRNICANIIIDKATFVDVVKRESYFEGTEVDEL